jgi:hypothetical protein
MAKLDRMLASVEWDLKYPMSKLTILPKNVSDLFFVLKNGGWRWKISLRWCRRHEVLSAMMLIQSQYGSVKLEI